MISGRANAARSLARLPRRLPYGRPFTLSGRTHAVRFEPAAVPSWRATEDTLLIALPGESARSFMEAVPARRGSYRWAPLPGLEIVVVPSEIKDHDGQVVQVIG